MGVEALTKQPRLGEQVWEQILLLLYIDKAVYNNYSTECGAKGIKNHISDLGIPLP